MDKTALYIERINKVVDYIEANIEEKMVLDTLAKVAGLSKYHFHRIFNAFTDESLFVFISRLRVERAAALLLTQDKTITEIAFACGFNDSATFARAFKKHFNVSARDWKKSKNSNIGQDLNSNSGYTSIIDGKQGHRIQALGVEEVIFQEACIAYVRHTGSYEGDGKLFYSLHKKLTNWAGPAGLLNYPMTKDIVIYHDPKGITEEEKLRISVGITVADDVAVQGEIGKLLMKKGRYLNCTFELGSNEYASAWKHVFRVILPRKGLVPDEGYCYEQYPFNCYNKEKDTTTLSICIPVKKI